VLGSIFVDPDDVSALPLELLARPNRNPRTPNAKTPSGTPTAAPIVGLLSVELDDVLAVDDASAASSRSQWCLIRKGFEESELPRHLNMKIERSVDLLTSSGSYCHCHRRRG